MNKIALIVSCEHAVNIIPRPYQDLFIPFESLLQTHRGLDIGALEVALHFKQVFSCALMQAPTSRLLIDYNRSLNNQCFSEITRSLPKAIKEEIINTYYFPYRKSVIAAIETQINKGFTVLHCSIHSFTPILNNIQRNAEIGFLHDRRRLHEKRLCKEWKESLNSIAPEYKIRMNYPYKGINDGLTTSLRKIYHPDSYIGIEVEVNQSLIKSLNPLKNNLTDSLALVLP